MTNKNKILNGDNYEKLWYGKRTQYKVKGDL